MADKISREELLELQLVETRMLLAQERHAAAIAARERYIAELTARHGAFENVSADGTLARPGAKPPPALAAVPSEP